MTDNYMRSGELFAGVGGLGLAVDEVFGTRPAWLCEFDAAPSKVLAHRHPDVPNLGDVRAVDFRALPHTHVRAGGFPCQDVSLAGRRRGMQGGTRSGLWSEFARSIEEDRPEWVVIENVRGLLSADGEPWHEDLIAAAAERLRLTALHATAEAFAWGNPSRNKEGRSHHAHQWRAAAIRLARRLKWAVARFDRERRLVQRAIAIVLRDLAELGFDAEWTGIRASDVGAPHGRFRVFILAWPAERTVPDTSSLGWGEGRTEPARPPRRPHDELGHADADLTLLPTPLADPETGNGHARHLGGEVTLLLTPTVVMNDGESVESWSARRERVKATGVNGNGMGMPLPIAVQLLPTPSVSNAHGNDVNGRGEPLLPGAVQLLPTPGAYDGERGGSQHPDKRRGGGHSVTLQDVAEHSLLLPTPTVAMAEGGQSSRSGNRKDELLLGGIAAEQESEWGPYTRAIRRWEAVTGRPAPAPVRHDGKGGKPRLNPELTEWMMGWPAGWVTDPAIGLSRAEQLKACGNGVVPQQAAAALRELLARPGVPSIRPVAEFPDALEMRGGVA
ncbi:DNA cytosine methyltransferase [Microbacterium arborescens]